MLKSRADREAEFATIRQLYGNLIRKAIHKVFPSCSEFDLQDIEQEVHIKIWKMIEAQQKIAYPATYYYKVAATTAVDALRKIRAKQQEPITEGTQAAAQPAENQLSGIVQTVLKRLAEARAIAVRLYLQGYNAEEIAELMKWSSGRARNLLYRGLEDLRMLLKKEGIYYESER